MEIKNELKPSLMRTNARYRGPTESEKYTNMMGEIAHDIKLLSTKLDRNEFIFNLEKGQSDFIRNNMAVYFNGENKALTSTIGTAAKIIGLQEEVLPLNDIGNAAWTVYGGCVKGGTVTERTLQSPGTQTPSGVNQRIAVVEGQILYFRIKVRLLAGEGQFLSIGSSDVNNGEGVLHSFTLPAGGSYVYVGVMIPCKFKETITLNIDVARGGTATAKIGISELSVNNVLLEELHLESANVAMKRRINALEEEIQNIMNNM